MPAYGFFGPVGRAAAVVRVPSAKKAPTSAEELLEFWAEVRREQGGLQTGGAHWVKHNVDYSELDFGMQAMINAVDAEPVRVDTTAEPLQASDVLAATKAHLGTCVLATVHCPAWLLHWQQSVAYLIIMSQRCCRQLVLHTLKGGPQCDCEVLFILNLLKELGFMEKWFRVEEGVVSWLFAKKRRDQQPFQVLIRSHCSVEAVTNHDLALGMLPEPICSRSPNLLRAAVVSAPVTILGDPPRRVDEVLNMKLMHTLQNLESMAMGIGWWELGKTEEAWENALRFMDEVAHGNADAAA